MTDILADLWVVWVVIVVLGVAVYLYAEFIAKDFWN